MERGQPGRQGQLPELLAPVEGERCNLGWFSAGEKLQFDAEFARKRLSKSIRMTRCRDFSCHNGEGPVKKAKNVNFSPGLLTQITVLGTLKRFHETALRVCIDEGAITNKSFAEKPAGKIKGWQ